MEKIQENVLEELRILRCGIVTAHRIASLEAPFTSMLMELEWVLERLDYMLLEQVTPEQSTKSVNNR